MRVFEEVVTGPVTMECYFNPTEVSAYWKWTNPFDMNEEQDLPLCWHRCKQKPPSRIDLMKKWSKRVI
jgi:hypothetical protein